MKLEPAFPDWLFVCFLSTWHWNAANRHSWYGSYYETRNYFNCPSNSLPVAVNKIISFSSSLTHVVADKGAAPSDQGWWKAVGGLQPLPSPGPRGLQPARGCCWGRDWPLSPLLQPVLTQLSLYRLCPSPLQMLSFTGHFKAACVEIVLGQGKGRALSWESFESPALSELFLDLSIFVKFEGFFPLSRFMPCKRIQVKTEKQLNPKE